ncbi:unnamed protein product [Prorocentrum cordatum]|uniref:Cellulase n=1 Tax=Prorocentrum cordatum TaxID=2364126 RepID=A0ABN9XML7_9DINO|nr:unnamed protein product [Polarella glacialis]
MVVNVPRVVFLCCGMFAIAHSLASEAATTTGVVPVTPERQMSDESGGATFLNNWYCSGTVINFGYHATAASCEAQIFDNTSCGSDFMQPTYPSWGWGCRCCAPAAGNDHYNTNW